jgi:hypothetical protein
MDTSTQTGDVEQQNLNVDSTAALLLERSEARQTETVIPETTEVPDEPDSLEVAESTDEPDDSEQQESEPEDAQPEAEAARFETIAELAEAADMPIDEFMAQIKLTTKVNGTESAVSLSDLKKGYQLEADYTRKNQEWVEAKKADDSQRESARSEISSYMQKTGQAFKMAQSELTNEFNSINWNELQASDPNQYLIKRQNFGERQARINQAIDQATQQAQAFSDQQTQATEQARQDNLIKQGELLNQAIPSWKDPAVRDTEAKGVATFLTEQGFSSDELENLTDHRIILLARSAMSAGKDVSAIELAKKKVQKVPKLVKSNARQNQNLSSARATEKLTTKFKSSGTTDDLAALLLHKRKA